MSLAEVVTIGTTAITLGKSLWDEYSDKIPDWLKDKAKEKGIEYVKDKWEKFQFGRAEIEYKKRIAEIYGTTKLLGSAGDSAPTPLDGIFTDIYILEKTLASRRYSIEKLKECESTLYGHEVKRNNGIELVKKSNSKRLFILGKPGAGKTTFLKYITLQAVKGELPKTPIFISLYEWSKAVVTAKGGRKVESTLIEFIAKQFDICHFPEAEKFIDFLLEKGDAIVLFDGLDEVNSIHNNRIITEVKNFCNKYTKAQCLITCRIAATEYSFEHFTYVEVADFNNIQIKTFVKNWFKDEPIKRDKFLEDFKKPEHSGVKDLAKSPLLLGMLCLAFADSMEFSPRRIDIYEDAIDALLRKWDNRRNIERDVIYKGLSHNKKKSLFTTIAYKTFIKNEYLIEEKSLVKYLDDVLETLPNPDGQDFDGALFLKAIEARHGIFVERAQKYHAFAHLSFQEYFAACAISKNEKYQQALMENITDPRYHEVFLLAASSLDNADDFFKLFKQAIDDLIIKDEKIIALLEWAKNKVNTIESTYSKQDIYLFYFFLEIIIDFASSFTHPLSQLYLVYSNALSFAYSHTIDHSLARAIDRVHHFNLNLNFGRINIRDLKIIGLDYVLYLVQAIFYRKSFFSRRKDIVNILFFMKSISLFELAKSFQNKKWSDLELKIKNLTEKQDIAHEWNLSLEQIELLISYVNASKLCRDCLNLATVSNRQAIEDSLFFTAKPEN